MVMFGTLLLLDCHTRFFRDSARKKRLRNRQAANRFYLLRPTCWFLFIRSGANNRVHLRSSAAACQAGQQHATGLLPADVRQRDRPMIHGAGDSAVQTLRHVELRPAMRTNCQRGKCVERFSHFPHRQMAPMGGAVLQDGQAKPSRRGILAMHPSARACIKPPQQFNRMNADMMPSQTP